jgi:hypothetical protein
MDETGHLAQADQHIGDGERRITEEERRLADLKAAGLEPSAEWRLLSAFRKTLAELHAYRRAILARLERR